MGNAVPRKERWRAYIPAVAGILGLALSSAITFFEPDIESWRSIAGWSMIGMSTFCIVIGIGWIHGHHVDMADRDDLEETLYSEGKSYIGIAFSAAVIMPPLIRLIFGPFE